ncbi:MAG TPA: hypothetical protein VF111_05705, partial [Thermoanaerobaculia bacterium]
MITLVDSTSGFAFDDVSVTVTPVGGGFCPGGVGPPIGGAVGVSPLHAAKTNTIASSASQCFRSLNVFMSTP